MSGFGTATTGTALVGWLDAGFGSASSCNTPQRGVGEVLRPRAEEKAQEIEIVRGVRNRRIGLHPDSVRVTVRGGDRVVGREAVPVADIVIGANRSGWIEGIAGDVPPLVGVVEADRQGAPVGIGHDPSRG